MERVAPGVDGESPESLPVQTGNYWRDKKKAYFWRWRKSPYHQMLVCSIDKHHDPNGVDRPSSWPSTTVAIREDNISHARLNQIGTQGLDLYKPKPRSKLYSFEIQVSHLH